MYEVCMQTGLKYSGRALYIHARLAICYYLGRQRNHEEKYKKRAFSRAIESYNAIGEMLVSEIGAANDVAAICSGSDAYTANWVTNSSKTQKLRVAPQKYARNLDALATGVGGNSAERMFPKFADNDP